MKSLVHRPPSPIFLLLSLALCIAMPTRAFADAATPTLAITHVPAYGTREFLTGKVQAPNSGTFDPSAYHVTLYVQINEYQQCWVKPSSATPFIDVLADGSFALDSAPVDTDRSAKFLHVLLIPADFRPQVNGFSEAKEAALDYVKITRATDGSGYVVDPADRELAPHCKPSGLAVSDNKLAVDVGLYTSGQPGDTLSDDRIRLLLSQVAEFADTVRFYRSTGPEQRACEIASNMGLKVVGTALLTGNAAQDQAEMNALVELCNNGYVQVACVGNETLFSGKLTPKTLVADINYVRSRLTADVPVTTSETLDYLRDNPVVCNACDILMPNIYPFWGGASINNAAGAFQSSLEGLAERMPYKEIVVSETGWPTAGDNLGSAVTGEAQARIYFEGVRQWSLGNQAVVLWFAAADEPWKTDEGSVGAHWGLMDTNLHVKGGFADLALFNSLTTNTVSLLDDDVVIQTASYQYDGSAKKPAVSVSHDGTTLTKNIDYTVTYQNNVNAGTGRVIVEGLGQYVGSITKSFSITCATPIISKVENARGGMKVAWKKVPGATAYRVFCKAGSGGWNKVADTTSASLLAKTSNGKTALKTGTKYSFSVRCVLKKGSNTYTSSLSVGKGTVYVASTALSSAKSTASRQATIRWKKVAKASGYKVQYSKKKNFSSPAKTVTIKKGRKVTAKLSSLTGGKTYFVRVRAYRVVGGKTYYAAWSAAKRVKVKK